MSPKDEVKAEDTFVFLTEEADFVSNGGYKLERGLNCFHEDVGGAVAVDLGASTGGFTDCLLKRGIKKVYCVDVGTSQLDPRIASDPRVVVMDETNARYLTARVFSDRIDLVTADLSFISLRLVLPAVKDVLHDEGRAFVLFKPQFECEGKGLGKSGILPQTFHAKLLTEFYRFACELGMNPRDIVNAPLRAKKNIEYIILLDKIHTPMPLKDFLAAALNFDRKF